MRRLAVAAVAFAVFANGTTALAQPGRRPTAASRPPPSNQPPPAADPQSTALRARFGVEMALRLTRSNDPDDRLRGIARAAAVGTPEAVAVLVQSLEAQGAARGDARALIEVARGLSPFVDQISARNALAAIVNAPTPSPRGARSSTDSDDGDSGPRTQLARDTAALALAGASDPRAAEMLVPIARGGGPGQGAASLALAAFPPIQPGTLASTSIAQPATLRLLAALGDLRTIDAIRASARANEPATRAAALLALGELGDARGADLARAAMGERDPRVRAAGAEALILLETPEKFKAVEALLGDDTTALAGARLAERAQSPSIVKALAARAVSSQFESIRSAATAALGRSVDPEAVRALVELLKYPLLQGDAADALARSPSVAAMPAIAKAAAQLGPARRMGVRAYVVRTLMRGEKNPQTVSIIEQMARSNEVTTRTLGVFALVALGDLDLPTALGDRDPKVRRAAAMGSLGSMTPDAMRTLLLAYARETDEDTRAVLALGLLSGDPDGRVTTTALHDRATSGGPDAALATMALARRTDAAHDAKVNQLLASRDPLLRAHAARGLGMSAVENAAGRLSAAYAYEPSAQVRRAIVVALAAQPGDDKSTGMSSPSRRATLDVASRLDPDAQIRFIAGRAVSGQATPLSPSANVEVAWLRLATTEGESPPTGMLGALIRADGVAVPVAFDDDGYALVPGTPAGDARLVLAPRLPAYEAQTP